MVQLFGFITQLLTMESDELENQPKAPIEVYSNNLNNHLLIALKHSVPGVKLNDSGFFLNRLNKDDRPCDATHSPLKVLNCTALQND